jgi:hypothetical protein
VLASQVRIIGQSQKEEKHSGPYSTCDFARLAFTSPSKNCDKQIAFIVRVIGWLIFYNFPLTCFGT